MKNSRLWRFQFSTIDTKMLFKTVNEQFVFIIIVVSDIMCTTNFVQMVQAFKTKLLKLIHFNFFWSYVLLSSLRAFFQFTRNQDQSRTIYSRTYCTTWYDSLQQNALIYVLKHRSLPKTRKKIAFETFGAKKISSDDWKDTLSFIVYVVGHFYCGFVSGS